MRTSGGGRNRPAFDPSMWEEKESGAYKCKECGDIHWNITNPSPNTNGGMDRIRFHQTRHNGGGA
jgi:hypothetical protein